MKYTTENLGMPTKEQTIEALIRFYFYIAPYDLDEIFSDLIPNASDRSFDTLYKLACDIYTREHFANHIENIYGILDWVDKKADPDIWSACHTMIDELEILVRQQKRTGSGC